MFDLYKKPAAFLLGMSTPLIVLYRKAVQPRSLTIHIDILPTNMEAICAYHTLTKPEGVNPVQREKQSPLDTKIRVGHQDGRSRH